MDDPHNETRLRKPLYLDAAGIVQVRAEGPALRIRMREGPDRHYPLARLSRIVVRGDADVRGDAMLAVLRSGLGMTWLEASGTLVGHVLSACRRSDALLDQRLEDLSDTGELPHVLENWRLAMMRRLILRLVAPRLGWLKDLRARTIRRKAAARIHERTGCDWRKEMRHFHPLLLSLALEKWRDAGISAAWLDPGPERPDLAGLVAGLLEWPMWRTGLQLKRNPELRNWHARIAFFERHHQRFQRECAGIVDHLARHLLATLPGLAE